MVGVRWRSTFVGIATIDSRKYFGACSTRQSYSVQRNLAAKHCQRWLTSYSHRCEKRGTDFGYMSSQQPATASTPLLRGARARLFTPFPNGNLLWKAGGLIGELQVISYRGSVSS